MFYCLIFMEITVHSNMSLIRYSIFLWIWAKRKTTALQKIYYICSSETAVSETAISELGMKGMSL